MSFRATRLARGYEMNAAAPRERVFPLLCPVREYEWLPYWTCQLVYCANGRAEAGCVFTTDQADGGSMTWVVTAYEPPAHIQFTVMKAGSHVWTLDICLTSVGSDSCRLEWRHTFTGLSEAGNQFLAEYTEEKHYTHLQRIERCLRHFLDTGRLLKAD
jgi:hypothetical protein